MRLILLIASLLVAVGMSAAPASAYSFGDQEDLHSIIDVGVKGENGEPLALGYKTTTHNFLLPYSISDDGYVLVIRDEPGTYYDLAPDDLAEWQQAGLIPDPLPVYKLSTLDLVMGYLLWPTLVLIGLLIAFGQYRKSRAAARGGGLAEPPEPPSTGAA